MFNAFFFVCFFLPNRSFLVIRFSLCSLTALLGSEDMHEARSKHVFILIKL